MPKVLRNKLKLDFDYLQNWDASHIFWRTIEDWVQDCEALGAVLPVFRAAGALNLIEISPRESIAVNPSFKKEVYHLLNECDLIFDRHVCEKQTVEIDIKGSGMQTQGFVPTPGNDSIKGFHSTDVPGIYLVQWGQE